MIRRHEISHGSITDWVYSYADVEILRLRFESGVYKRSVGTGWTAEGTAALEGMRAACNLAIVELRERGVSASAVA